MSASRRSPAPVTLSTMGSAVARANVTHSQADVLHAIRHLLDVGGGTGVNASLLVRAYPEMRITILDLPSVVAAAAESVQDAGLTDRVGVVAGNFLRDEFP